MIQAYVFDAYGTLYDVQSVFETVERACPGKGALITQIWRLKQLEYSWLRSCMEDFADFEVVTRDSLAFALGVAGVDPAATLLDDVTAAYLELSPVADALATLEGLAGRPRAILSNGSVRMLEALVQHSGFDKVLEHVISVDGAQVFKPSPRAYALVPPVLGVSPSQTLFVSSNGFDVAGAKRFGFRVAWIRRNVGPPPEPAQVGPGEMFAALRGHAERLGAAADVVLGSLAELGGVD
jgi:2-haloacid dehalogenase